MTREFIVLLEPRSVSVPARKNVHTHWVIDAKRAGIVYLAWSCRTNTLDFR